ncbi:anti-sigma factor antagonist [Crossiella sp. CA-258035]|uniref:anti-sigma factor antagonist n=1 Tax=Crossiella sp. CA-258035 TaxID=2981138 RepID=UPI0024BCE79D|nr:anti-sigma factor antagonist [Crossiella sp. CA-258035]WHT22952.1 anti-sigma factor antagonist [Crossiella sp. CA-258035]
MTINDSHPGNGMLGVGWETRGTAVVLSVTGELDLATVPVLEQHVQAALEGLPGGRLVLDLREVGFLSSAGLALLAEHTARNDVWVVADQHAVIRPLTVTGLLATLRLAPTVDQALAPAGEPG